MLGNLMTSNHFIRWSFVTWNSCSGGHTTKWAHDAILPSSVQEVETHLVFTANPLKAKESVEHAQLLMSLKLLVPQLKKAIQNKQISK